MKTDVEDDFYGVSLAEEISKLNEWLVIRFDKNGTYKYDHIEVDLDDDGYCITVGHLIPTYAQWENMSISTELFDLFAERSDTDYQIGGTGEEMINFLTIAHRKFALDDLIKSL